MELISTVIANEVLLGVILFAFTIILAIAALYSPSKKPSNMAFLLMQGILSVPIGGLLFIVAITYSLGCSGLAAVLILSVFLWIISFIVSSRLFIQQNRRKQAVAISLGSFVGCLLINFAYIVVTLFLDVSCSGEFLT